MGNLVSILAAVVCMAICVRLVAFRRDGQRYRFGVSVLAYLLAMATGCQSLATLFGMYPIESPFVLGILVLLCVLVYRARGNVASIVRLEWAWPAHERRRLPR